MWLSDSYEVPKELIDNPPSPAFRQFLLYWFGSNRIEVFERLRVINELAPEEIPVAQRLVRQNLKTKRNHLINATWLLHDTSAAPLLRMMLEEEPSRGRQLTIAGALWKLVNDPVFIELLERAKGTDLFPAHLHQVPWLDDERAIDFLIGLLPDTTNATGRWALGMLNRLESGQFVPPDPQRPPAYYRSRQFDPALPEHMLAAIHAGNRNGQFLLL